MKLLGFKWVVVNYFGALEEGVQNIWRFTGGQENILSYSTSNMNVKWKCFPHVQGLAAKLLHAFEVRCEIFSFTEYFNPHPRSQLLTTPLGHRTHIEGFKKILPISSAQMSQAKIEKPPPPIMLPEWSPNTLKDDVNIINQSDEWKQHTELI